MRMKNASLCRVYHQNENSAGLYKKSQRKPAAFLNEMIM